MSVGAFLMTFFACAAVLAVWLDFRLGERYPQSIAKVLLHGGCSLLVLQVVITMTPALMSPDEQARSILALFFVVLPGLMYVFLASIWFLKLVRSAMPH
jgi:hypothetical protein